MTQFGSKDVREYRAAEWEGYRRLAKLLPDHHVLSVQLIRTRTNETAAIFTTVRHGQPVRSVLMGDARGRAYPNQYEPQHDEDCGPNGPRIEAFAQVTPVGGDSDGSDQMTPDTVAIGSPPVKQPITPGLIALGTTLLAATFDLGEVVESGTAR